MVGLCALLAKKTLRELLKIKGPAFVLSCVMAAGLSSLIMSQSNLKSLLHSQLMTYQTLDFADAVIPLSRMPRHLVAGLETIEGIRRAECRLTQSGQVRLPHTDSLVQARIHSLPAENSLNNIRIVEGRLPAPSASGEAVLADAFAKAWKIRSGDSLSVVMNGKEVKLRISGLVRSPEYIYQTGSASSVPDDALFSVWWVNRRLVEKTANLESSCNEILLSLGSESSLTMIEKEVSSRLQNFGFMSIIPRKRQLSHYFLESELQQLKGMSLYMPALFLAVTLFLLNITMTRILLTQRESIGTLRAFGFEKALITGQSMLLALLCLLPGLVFGLALGLWLAKKLFDIYILFYRFAVVSYQVDITSVIIAILLCLVTAMAGCLIGLRSIFRESPALALIPAAPRHTQMSVLDTLPCLGKLNLYLRMSLRNIFRRPLQSLVTCGGLILATALLLFARFEDVSIHQLLVQEYDINQQQSHTFTFSRRLPATSLKSFRAYLPDGVVEGGLTLPVTVKYGLFARELTLFVEPIENLQLRRTHSPGSPMLNAGGLSISQPLANLFRRTPPFDVVVMSKERKQAKADIPVTGISDTFMGTLAFMNSKDFTTSFRETRSFNTILFRSSLHDSPNQKLLFSRFPALVGVAEKDFERMAFERTIAENIGIFRNFMIGFAFLISFGVLYNNSRIQLAEREREFALMRALGFSEDELTLFFWTDFVLLTVLALAPGLVLGRKILELLMQALETEIFWIPVVITLQSNLWAVTTLLMGVLLTALIIQPLIRKISDLSILKSRE